MPFRTYCTGLGFQKCTRTLLAGYCSVTTKLRLSSKEGRRGFSLRLGSFAISIVPELTIVKRLSLPTSDFSFSIDK